MIDQKKTAYTKRKRNNQKKSRYSKRKREVPKEYALIVVSKLAFFGIFRRQNGDITHLTLVKSIPIYRGVFLFMPMRASDMHFIRQLFILKQLINYERNY